ncbi:MAG TPA: ribosome biogenesis GTPase Der [Candidatus Binatia bacterium]|jgi:GTP-binding protein
MAEAIENISTAATLPQRLPVLALVGRPNVGKSTFFNRLTRQRKAIVHDLPGVTRDRNYGTAEWSGRKFLVIDTGGFEPEAETALKKQVQEQTRLAIEEADAILFLFDGKAGLHPLDRDAVDLLRRVPKPVFFAANKIDSRARENGLYEFYALGVDEILPVSAEHGVGVGELLDRVVKTFPEETDTGIEAPAEKETKPLALAVVGRPNVGKSTLANRLLGYERSVVDTTPGTTRDAIDTPLEFGGKSYTLIDTAGIRRKARIADRLEQYSVVRSLGSIDRGDVIVYIIDGTEGVTSQDAQILAYAAERGKGLVLAVNKWDAVAADKKDPRAYRQEVYRKLPFVDFAPVKFISAATGQGVGKMMAAVKSVAAAYKLKIPTSPLNQALRAIFAQHPPPLAQGKPVKFFYATQIAVGPPTFALFVNFAHGIGPAYERYLVHQLREALGFEGAPLRLSIRGRREEGTNVQARRQKLNPPKNRRRSRRRS